jgi:hypothetical protein
MSVRSDGLVVRRHAAEPPDLLALLVTVAYRVGHRPDLW